MRNMLKLTTCCAVHCQSKSDPVPCPVMCSYWVPVATVIVIVVVNMVIVSRILGSRILSDGTHIRHRGECPGAVLPALRVPLQPSG